MITRTVKDKRSRRSGFTLIEIIAALMLTSVAAAFAGMLLTTSTQIYFRSRATAEDSQKIQLAMNRLVKELTWGNSSLTGVSDTITWTSFHPDQPGLVQTASLDEASSELLLGGVPLIDGVAAFQVWRVGSTGAIQISLRSERVPGITHTTRLYPRE